MSSEEAAAPGVLVADDEESVREMLARALRREGLRVWLAPGGQEAVELFREHQADIAVALLDVRMPGRTGPEALARMRELRPGLPCVFITGQAGAQAEEQMRALGCRVVGKPFRLDEVVAAVREAAREAVTVFKPEKEKP